MAQVDRRTVLAGLGGSVTASVVLPKSAEAASSPMPSQAATVRAFGGRRPTYWGMHAPGTISRFSTSTSAGRQAVCLTFDACGGRVTRFDAELISVLRHHRVRATLFINRTWAVNNARTFHSLLADPLFEVENHGWAHRPLSVNGRSAYGIAGTRSAAEVWSEIAACRTYYGATYRYTTRFMRPGTAYSDDVAAAIARSMGQPLVTFSKNIDAGATLPAASVYSEMLKMRPGDIGIGHFNHPGSGTAAGVARAIPVLKSRGIVFRTLRDVLR